MLEGIGIVDIDKKGGRVVYQHVSLAYRLRYLVGLNREAGGRVAFVSRTIRDGSKEDGPDAGGDSERFIEEIRDARPDEAIGGGMKALREPVMKDQWYFAYGGNLSSQQAKERMDSVEEARRARLNSTGIGSRSTSAVAMGLEGEPHV
ncbi:MAG: hypothetical protein Fur0037_11340 [Planctomycetota bacterium]